MAAPFAAEHNEWLSLLDVSGPFLTLPVLLQYLPAGLDKLEGPDKDKPRALRTALAARDAAKDPQEACRQYVRSVLTDVLDYDASLLLEAASQQEAPHLSLPEMGEELRPDFVLMPPKRHTSTPLLLDLEEPAQENEDPPAAPVLLVSLAPGCRLDAPIQGGRCAWSPARRMAELCRASGTPLGLVSNGHQFMLVHARQNCTTTFVTWEADLWLEERITLRSFVTLLRRKRFFGVPEEETLPRLMEKSAEAQQAVTERLGEQVRSALTEFLRALDRLDRQSGGKSLLGGIPAKELYVAALTVMMRLVFLLSAEERGLLRLGEAAYDQAYAASTLCGALREEADRQGEEVLEYRHDAWVRLLSLFRAVYGGVRHEHLRLPAYGGSLFDPDAYPFLEGRAADTTWRETAANPLPVDNRVILHMLESLQFLRDKRTTGRDEAVRLSFRGLDVEQIGHVYEGLLDRTARRAKGVLLGLTGKGEPFLPLVKAEVWLVQGEDRFLEHLAEVTGATQASLRRQLSGTATRGRGRRAGQPTEADQRDEAARAEARLRVACDGDEALMARVRPFARLLRQDSFGLPLVVPDGGLYVTAGSQRRDTGTHYTPRHLTELLVSATLEPHVYDGPSQGLPREEWKLHSPDKLLSLKVCDMTMGSGAFLVQTCRYLADRLLEAWANADEEALQPFAPLPEDAEERLALARRLVADRCLYGVDNNPLAVEMAKLSLWLTTLQKERPFTFLDHALRCGDALMGLTDMRQLEEFTLHPDATSTLVFGSTDMRASVQAAQKARDILESIPSDTPLNVERKAALLEQSTAATRKLRQRADALIMATVQGAGALSEERRYEYVDKLLSQIFSERPDELDAWLEGQRQALIQGSGKALPQNEEDNNPGFTRPFHWVLEYPEIFDRENPGFDALVGNPPFLGSQRMREALGNFYREYLVEVLGHGVRGQADIVAYFFLRAAGLVRRGGDFGLVATNTVAQGATREAGLLLLERAHDRIRASWPDTPWEGSATVCTSQVVVRHDAGEVPYAGDVVLSDVKVESISSFLKAGGEEWEAKPLTENKGIGFQGTIILGDGFLTTEGRARQWIAEDARNAEVLFPYLIGDDLTSSPTQAPSRWVINFYDWGNAAAQKYQKPFAQVEEKVKPFRATNPRRPRREKWWQYAEKATGLYHALGRGDAFIKHPGTWKSFPPLERVLAISMVSKHGAFAFVPNTSIFAMMLVVFASADAALFGLLQSTIHHVWARKMCSTLETRLRYTPSSAFDAFPRPLAVSLGDVRDSAEDLHTARAEIMQRENIGLTTLYNHLHDSGSRLADVEGLRARHEELDRLVADAYGWTDLDMTHDFRQVDYLPANDNTRHTIAEPVRLEVLRRLSALNRQRWQVEQEAQGRPAATGGTRTQRTRRTRRRNGGPEQGTL